MICADAHRAAKRPAAAGLRAAVCTKPARGLLARRASAFPTSPSLWPPTLRFYSPCGRKYLAVNVTVLAHQRANEGREPAL